MAVYSYKVLVLIYFMFTYVCDLNAIVYRSEDDKINQDYFIHWLKANETAEANGSRFSIFCQFAVPKSIIYLWRNVYLEFERTPREYRLFEGENETAVYEKYNSETIFNPASWLNWRDTVVSFPSFNQYCLGVSTSSADTYTLRLKVRTINYWKVLQMIIGVVLFFSAPSLSRNPFFHYTSGVGLGVIASVLILLFIVSKFVPKKSASYSILIFGASFIAYILQQLYQHIPQILSNYMEVVLGYTFLSAFISFIFCYRFGPVESIRTFNLIQWTMQGIGALLIFFSTEYREVSTALIMVMLVVYTFPATWTTKAKRIWCWYFPPKVKLLTESEYIEQGYLETKKALEELRVFCNSPECKTWTTVKKLHDPIRFARFVDGESHLTDEEILLYDSEAGSEVELDDSQLMTEDDDENHISLMASTSSSSMINSTNPYFTIM